MEYQTVDQSVKKVKAEVDQAFSKTFENLKDRIQKEEYAAARTRIVEDLKDFGSDVSFKPNEPDADEKVKKIVARIRCIQRFLDPQAVPGKVQWTYDSIVSIAKEEFGIADEAEALCLFLCARGHMLFERYEDAQPALVRFLCGFDLEKFGVKPIEQKFRRLI